MPSLGQELKREREMRGISLEEMASATKIRLFFLKALEEDKLNLLPEKFFTRAIIKNYAKFIGLDENYYLNKYLEIFQCQGQKHENEQKANKLHSRPLAKRGTLLAAILLIILSLLLYLVFRAQRAPKKEEKAQAPPVAVKLPSEQTESQAPVTLKEEEKELLLELNFTDRTWIQVYADGELRLDGIKKAGEKVTLCGQKELLIHLGNAGGVEFTLNSRKGKPFGRRGAVVKNIRITLENFRQFVIPQEEEHNF